MCQIVDRPAFVERLQQGALAPEEQPPNQPTTTGTSKLTHQYNISSHLTNLDEFLEGYDSSETMTWSSWGDFSAAADE
jgi:hypothetical protein